MALAVERRWATIALSLLVMLVLAAGARHIVEVDVDVRNHFGSDDPHIVALDLLEDTYALSDAALVAVAPDSGAIFTREALVAVEELTDRLWRTPWVTRVDSITNHSHSEGVEDELIVDPLIDDAGSLSDDDMERIRTIALGTEEVAGRFVSRDGRVAGLVVSVALPEDRQRGKQEVTDFLHATVAAAREAHPDIGYHLTGELVLNRAMRDAIDDEMGVLAPVALGTMLLVAILLLRSIWGTVAIVVMLVAVLASALGFTGWTGMRLFGESGAALFVLMAVTVAHSVHVIEGMVAGLRQGMDRKQAAIRSMEINTWPVFLTSLTTAIGFLSLNFADMPPFQVMGNMVAFGALCAFVWSVTLLPALLSLVPIRGRPPPAGKLDFFERLGRFVVSWRLTLLWSFGALIVVLVAGISRIDLEENWLELLDESYEFRRSTDFISQNFTGVESYEYSLDSGRGGRHHGRRVPAPGRCVRAVVPGAAGGRPRLRRHRHHEAAEQEPARRRSGFPRPSGRLRSRGAVPAALRVLPAGRPRPEQPHRRRALGDAHDGGAEEPVHTEKDRARQPRASLAAGERPGLETGATGVAVVGARSIQRNIEGMLVGTTVAMGIVSLLLLFGLQERASGG